MAELVYNREVNPCQCVESFELRCRRQVGVHYSNQPWLVSDLAKRRIAEMEGNRTLLKYLAVVGHFYQDDTNGLQGRVGGHEQQRQLESELSASRVRRPRRQKKMSLTSPAEKVVMTAVHKEKALLDKSRKAALQRRNV